MIGNILGVELEADRMDPDRAAELIAGCRVRTDPNEGYAYRHDAIQQAANRFDCNKSDAIVYACDTAGRLLDNVERALHHEDLPPRLARELAETISTPQLSIEINDPSVSIETK